MKGLYEQNKESIMNWRKLNKDKYLEYMRQYNTENRERIKEVLRKAYDDTARQKKREYYLKRKAIIQCQ